jgi:hypothetical protein
MNKRFILKPTALAASAMVGLAFFHLSASAQLASNSATIELAGSLTGPTCVLMAAPSGGGTATSANNQRIDLGTGNLTSATASTGIGSDLGGTWAAKTILFRLTGNGSVGDPCVFNTSGATNWDIQIAPVDTTLILEDGTNTFLKNAKTGLTGGTDAVVALKGGVGTSASKAINLTPTGTYISSGTQTGDFIATATGTNNTIALSAQLVNGKSSGKPTAGQYLTPVTLAVQYK